MNHLRTFEQQLQLFPDMYQQDDSDPYADVISDPEDKRGVVSFDFDGVLHSSVVPNSIHPIHYYNPRTWAPRTDVFELIEEESWENRVVIVTARNSDCADELWEFIHHFRLPIDEIYYTSNEPKLRLLKKLKAIRHYDDNPSMTAELKNSGIQFILSKPPYMTMEEYEEFEMDEIHLW